MKLLDLYKTVRSMLRNFVCINKGYNIYGGFLTFKRILTNRHIKNVQKNIHVKHSSKLCVMAADNSGAWFYILHNQTIWL